MGDNKSHNKNPVNTGNYRKPHVTFVTQTNNKGVTSFALVRSSQEQNENDSQYTEPEPNPNPQPYL